MNKLQALISDDLEKTLEVITDLYERLEGETADIIKHIINSGGKRIRPQFALCCAKLCGYKGEAHIKMAAIVELIHTATLLHDDVVDESDKRRNISTAHTIWGNKSAILAGDILFAYALELTTPKTLKAIAKSVLEIAKGEIKELSADKKLKTTKDEYMQIISAKTAKLFSLSCELGAAVSDKKADYKKALADFGCNFGIAFQLIDDVLDYTSKSSGKTAGIDFKNSKITLPVILSYERTDKEFWEKNFGKAKNFSVAKKIMQECGAIDDTIALAEKYMDKAKNSLEHIEENEYKNALIATADSYLTKVL